MVREGRIEWCVVGENEMEGIECNQSSPTVVNNLIERNGEGLYLYWASPSVLHNEIVRCEKGIVLGGSRFPLIKLNMLARSADAAISLEHIGGMPASQPVIEYNNLLENTMSVRMGYGNRKDISALHNWWGTTDEREIAGKIYDRDDQDVQTDPWMFASPIELCGQTEAEVSVTDDYLAFVVTTRLGLKAGMLPDLVVELAERGGVTVEVAKSIMEVIRPRYRVGMIEHSLVRLQEVKENAESCGAGEGGNSAGSGTSQGSGNG